VAAVAYLCRQLSELLFSLILPILYYISSTVLTGRDAFDHLLDHWRWSHTVRGGPVPGSILACSGPSLTVAFLKFGTRIEHGSVRKATEP
jgi:hypothetical protein